MLAQAANFDKSTALRPVPRSVTMFHIANLVFEHVTIALGRQLRYLGFCQLKQGLFLLSERPL